MNSLVHQKKNSNREDLGIKQSNSFNFWAFSKTTLSIQISSNWSIFSNIFKQLFFSSLNNTFGILYSNLVRFFLNFWILLSLMSFFKFLSFFWIIVNILRNVSIEVCVIDIISNFFTSNINLFKFSVITIWILFSLGKKIKSQTRNFHWNFRKIVLWIRIFKCIRIFEKILFKLLWIINS